MWSEKSNKSMALELHQQFAHVTNENNKLSRLPMNRKYRIKEINPKSINQLQHL